MFHPKKLLTPFRIVVIILCILFFYVGYSVSPDEPKVYFSLYDDPETVIIENISAAEESISIAMYTFTDVEIAQAILEARDRGIEVRIYLDRSQVKARYSRSRYFVKNNIEVRISSNNYIMHHKFAIIDGEVLLTGSYNWTESASVRNNENLLVINNQHIIERYRDQFNILWNEKCSPERYQKLIEVTE